MGVVKTLILSGGGGRGAFHAGVYKYLCQEEKTGVDENHQGTWKPDIVVGTSIGAVNGAAIVQGKSAEELADYREVRVTIVAPEEFFPATRILDYDQWIEQLILLGYQAAARAFRKDFPDGKIN